MLVRLTSIFSGCVSLIFSTFVLLAHVGGPAGRSGETPARAGCRAPWPRRLACRRARASRIGAARRPCERAPRARRRRPPALAYSSRRSCRGHRIEATSAAHAMATIHPAMREAIASGPAGTMTATTNASTAALLPSANWPPSAIRNCLLTPTHQHGDDGAATSIATARCRARRARRRPPPAPRATRGASGAAP